MMTKIVYSHHRGHLCNEYMYIDDVILHILITYKYWSHAYHTVHIVAIYFYHAWLFKEWTCTADSAGIEPGTSVS